MMQVLRSSPHWRTTLTRLSLCSLVLLALVAVCTQAQAQNTSPTAQPSSVDVSTDATAASPYYFKLSDFRFADMEGDALTEVGLRAPANGTLRVGNTVVVGTTAITRSIVAANAISTISYYPPTGQAQTRNYDTFFFYVTAAGTPANIARGTMTIHLFNPTQEAATGKPAVSAAAGTTVWNEDVTITAAIGAIADNNVINTGTLRWQWQSAPAPASGAPAANAYAAISGATSARFTPRQADVGTYIRVCASFRDLHPTPASEMRCTDGNIIANVSDAPEGRDTAVDVPITANAANPHDFDINDFPITDEDGDTLKGIRLASLPTAGTLVVAGETRTLTASSQLTLTELNALAYYPNPGASARNNYDSFDYRIEDTGTGSDRRSVDAYTLTINLFTDQQIKATGASGITPATSAQNPTHAEDTELTANTASIVEPNVINQSTLQWQWQSAPAPASGAPAADAYAAIAGATSRTFTPLQAHVGLYIRVCVSFMDEHATPAEEGPLCSAVARVRNVNDAPMALNNRVFVPSSADNSNPHCFSPCDFTFSDEDGDNLVELTVYPEIGTEGFGVPLGEDGLARSLSGSGTPVPLDATGDFAGAGGICFAPNANAVPTMGYNSFEFRVTTAAADGSARATSANRGVITVDLADPSEVPEPPECIRQRDLRLRLRIFLEGPLR